MAALIGVLVLIALYLVPTFIAAMRHHHNVVAIAALNILLGWSFIGWIAAFVWALTSPSQPAVIVNTGTGTGTVALPSPSPALPAGASDAPRPKFDTATGRPIIGYDPQTGDPILGERDA